jgi:transketolase C-terminal domain/subunit
MTFVGMQDRYGTSGRWDELLEHFQLSSRAIAEAAHDVLTRKVA